MKGEKLLTLGDDVDRCVALESLEGEEGAVPVVKRDCAGGVEEGSLEERESLSGDHGLDVGGHLGGEGGDEGVEGCLGGEGGSCEDVDVK